MKKNTQQIRKHALGMITLLVVQYVLGMLANLYVQFPEGASVGKNWEFMHEQWLLWAHMFNGTLIVAGTIALYIRAMQLKDKTWKIAGGVAAGSSILAWICGEEFVSKQIDLYSFAMSAFFIIALLSLGAGLYKTNKQ